MSARGKLFLVLVLASFFVFPKSAHADYESAYRDLTYTFSLYKQAHGEFQVAKSSYLTYSTLTSQNEAISKFRGVLKARNQVISSYYNLLQEKMNSTPGVGDEEKQTFSAIKESEKAWLVSNQQKVDAAASLDDLNRASDEFEGRHKQIDRETKQAIGTILLGKEITLKSSLDTLLEQLTGKLGEMRGSGEETSVYDRGVISARNKLDLFNQNFDAGRAIFFPKVRGDSEIKLFAGQSKLSEAKQYLQETVKYLTEIVNSITNP